jgi:hypothetical protein
MATGDTASDDRQHAGLLPRADGTLRFAAEQPCKRR